MTGHAIHTRVRYRTCGAYGNEHIMPPRIIRHCGRHMQFWFAALVFWCPMCGIFKTLEEVEDVGRD